MNRFNRFARAFLLACCFVLSATPTLAENILFYGNSFTNGFLSTDSVPNLVQDIATAAGQTTPNVVNAAVNAQDFSWHLSNNTTSISTGLPAGQQWDYAVLQNYSTAPTHLGNLAQHRADSVSLYQAIANHSPNVTPVLFETWARGPGHSLYTGNNPSFSGGPSQMQDELQAGYLLASQDIDTAAGAGIARIAHVGTAWEKANWTNLHADDIYHAQNRGTLLTALEIYSTVYQDDTNDIDLTSVLSGLGLAANDGLFLTSIVDGIPLPRPDREVTLKFNFGPGYHSGARHNVLPPSSQNIPDAIDFDTGLPTGVSLALTSPTGFNEAFTNFDGTTSPTAPGSDFFDNVATATSLFGHDSNFNLDSPRMQVEMTLSGLEPNRLYDFTFFASRTGVSDNRETQYTVEGLNSGVGLLDPANNVDEIAQVSAIQPNANGEVLLNVQKGPGNTNSQRFFYLGAMEIAAVGVIETANFDADDDIDGADFLTWQRGVGIEAGASLSLGDANGDGAVDSTDLALWSTQFATSSGLASAAGIAVPEPATSLMVFLALISLASGRGMCQP